MIDQRKPMANITPFGLRMQPDLKSKIEAVARENNRSINAEIVERLERSFMADSEIHTAIDGVEQQIEEHINAIGSKYQLDLHTEISRMKKELSDQQSEFLAKLSRTITP